MFVLGDSMTDEAFITAWHVTLRTMIDRQGCSTFNAGLLNLDADAKPFVPSEDAAAMGGYRPVVARVMSRGKLTSAASDFGGLEVMGGGSIGHCDPFALVKGIDAELATRGAVTVDTKLD